MKKYTIFIVALIFVTCSSTTEETVSVDTTTSTAAPVTTVQETDDTTTSTTEPTIEFIFDVEKMSPFTGKELPPETWLKRPKRVIAFKIDNNINARPQSGLQEADAVHEILVEGGMTRFLAFFYDNTSKYLGPIRSARPTDPTMIRPYNDSSIWWNIGCFRCNSWTDPVNQRIRCASFRRANNSNYVSHIFKKRSS